MHRINHPFASEPSGGVSLLLSYPASEETSERVRALQHSSGGRGLTGEERNGSREDSHTRSERWPAPLRASALKEHISLKEYTGDRVFLKMSYHPCVSGCGRSLAPQDGHDHCLTCLGIQHAEEAFVDVPQAEAALVPLREQGVRILNYLDDWLILAQSRRQLSAHRDLVLKHLSLLGLRVNWEKSKLVPTQRISFLGMEFDSVNQTARLTQERAQSVLNCFKTLSGRTAVPLKLFQRLLGHMAAAAVTVPLGLLHMRPLQHWLYGRIPRWAWKRGTYRVQITPACRKTFRPWSDPSFLRAGVPLEQVSRHAVVFTDASTTGWGATYNGHAVSGVWTGPQLHWHINCLELLAVRLALSRLRGRLQRKDVLVRTENTATVAYINRQGALRSRRNSPATSSSGVRSI